MDFYGIRFAGTVLVVLPSKIIPPPLETEELPSASIATVLFLKVVFLIDGEEETRESPRELAEL